MTGRRSNARPERDPAPRPRRPVAEAAPIRIIGNFRTDADGQVEFAGKELHHCSGIGPDAWWARWIEVWDEVVGERLIRMPRARFSFEFTSERPVPAGDAADVAEQAIRGHFRLLGPGGQTAGSALLRVTHLGPAKTPHSSCPVQGEGATVPEDMREHPAPRTEEHGDVVAEMRDALAETRAAFVGKFQDFLRRMEGKSFETHEEALEAVRLLRDWTRLAGHGLLYNGEPVTLRVAVGTGQTTPTIQLLSTRTGKQKQVFASQRLPSLRSGPIS